MEVEGFRDCWICKLELWSCWFWNFEICSHIILTGNFSPCRPILLDLLMPLFNFLALEVTMELCGGCFSFWLYFQQFRCWWPRLHTKQLARASSAWVMALDDVYNMDEIGSFYCAQPNKTLGQQKVRGCIIRKDRLTIALLINTISTKKLKLVIICKSLHPRCFGRCLPTNYVWWSANQMAWMTSNIFESWMMSLNLHFKLQKQKVLLIMNKYVIHSRRMLVGVNHLVFNFVVEQYYCFFLTTYCYKCGTTLGLV